MLWFEEIVYSGLPYRSKTFFFPLSKVKIMRVERCVVWMKNRTRSAHIQVSSLCFISIFKEFFLSNHGVFFCGSEESKY